MDDNNVKNEKNMMKNVIFSLETYPHIPQIKFLQKIVKNYNEDLKIFFRK